MPAQVRSTSKNTSLGGSVVVIRPPDLVSGDVMFACQSSTTSFVGVPNPPGWAPTTALNDTLNERLYTRLLRRTAGGAEASSYSFPTAGPGTVIIAALQDVDTSVTVRVAILDAYESSGAVVTPSVPPASASHLEVRFAAVAAFDGVTVSLAAPSGYTPRASVAINGQLTASVVSRQLSSSSPSGPKNFAITGANSGVTHGISVSVASGSTVPDVPPPPPFTPGVGSGLYQYRFCRLLDRSYLGHLDLVNVNFDKRILQPGTFSATIPIPSKKVGRLVKEIIPVDETVLDRGPGVIVCEIIRAGEYWGEYWITGAKPGRSRRGTPTVQLRGSTLDAYLARAELQEDLPFVGDDQIDIARALLSHMQALPNADIGLILQSGTSGVPRDHDYLANQGTYGQRLVELAELENGFEWTINTVAGALGLERHWVWATKLGQASPILHQFSDGQYGGDILEWAEDIDALRGATSWRARGGTSDTGDASTVSTPLISTSHEATAHLEAGWPWLPRTVNRSSVTVQQTLEDWAAYWAAKAPGALRVDSITVALGAKPSINPNSLGDMTRIRLDNEWHDRVKRDRRMIGIGITPESRSGKEEAQLILEGQEVDG